MWKFHQIEARSRKRSAVQMSRKTKSTPWLLEAKSATTFWSLEEYGQVRSATRGDTAMHRDGEAFAEKLEAYTREQGGGWRMEMRAWDSKGLKVDAHVESVLARRTERSTTSGGMKVTIGMPTDPGAATSTASDRGLEKPRTASE